MKKKYGQIIGIPMGIPEDKILWFLPGYIKSLIGSMQDCADKLNGVIDTSSLCFIYKHYTNNDGPLGIMIDEHPCRATIALKCDIEVEDNENGR